MVRVIVAGFVGAFIVFFWGALSWMVLSLWEDDLRSLPGDGAIEQVLTDRIPENGAYYFPGMPDMDDPAAVEAWEERHRNGPIGIVTIQQEGAEPYSLESMLGGFLISLLSALLIAGVLGYAGSIGSSYAGRLAIGIVFAIFAVASTYAMQWNWFWWPGEYATALSADVLIGWIIASIAMAGIVGGARAEPPMVAH